MVRIAGTLISGLLKSFQSIHALTGEDIELLSPTPIKEESWYTFDFFHGIIQKVEEKHADIKGLLFRAGIEFIRGWYHFGGGKDLVHNHLDFLQIQTDSQGYNMVVEADPPHKSGWVKMIRLDPEKGKCEIQSTVPFPPEFTQGVFVGGTNLLEDLDYLNVELQSETSPISGFYASRLFIRFIPKKELPHSCLEKTIANAGQSDLGQILRGLYWKYLGLEQQIKYEKIYRDQLNELLIKTTEDLQKKNLTLNKLVQELGATQSQMIQQEKMASLGQLTAGVAHEINNPINFVLNNTVVLDMDFQDLNPTFELLTQIQQNGVQQETVDQLEKELHHQDFSYLKGEIESLLKGIKGGSKRIATIVKSLKYLSYSDQEQKILTDIHEPIEATLTILQNKIKVKGIQVEKSFKDLSKIQINPAQINQVFINIISNAIQALAPEGIIKIQTSTLEERLRIRIEDNGNGMSKSVQKRIFEPFFTTKKIGEGTGLGLSISYGIIKAHGGQIEVKSTPGIGSTFDIYLPL